MSIFTWTGPFRISDLLAACLDDEQPWPPASRGVYVISRAEWQAAPTPACHPLYVGGNTGGSQRFCTRIGDLIADLHGFWDGGTGPHSGGQSLHSWCRTNKVHPSQLFICWATSEDAEVWCSRCAEAELIRLVTARTEERTLLNKLRPPFCRMHSNSDGLVT